MKFKKESYSLQSPSEFCILTVTACQALLSKHSFLFISTDGPLTPTKYCSIRHITAQVGAAVVGAAVAEDLAEACCDIGPSELESMSEVSYLCTQTAYIRIG